MDTSTALTDDIIKLLYQLVGYDVDHKRQRNLQEAVSGLIRTARAATTSYLGMAITVVTNEQPLTLTLLEPRNTIQSTSLSLSLSLLPSSDAAGRITFYAATPGTFADLAADLTFTLGEVDLRLDDDVTHAPIPGLTGLPELAAINRAHGILIGHGHTVGSAQRELRRRAETTLGTLHQAAIAIAADPASAALDR